MILFQLLCIILGHQIPGFESSSDPMWSHNISFCFKLLPHLTVRVSVFKFSERLIILCRILCFHALDTFGPVGKSIWHFKKNSILSLFFQIQKLRSRAVEAKAQTKRTGWPAACRGRGWREAPLPRATRQFMSAPSTDGFRRYRSRTVNLYQGTEATGNSAYF